MKTDDVFILINAVLGNFKDVKTSLAELVVDDDMQASKIPADPMIKILAN